jgi:peptidoglycan/LPS O-acetylase OafA/YrhL
MASSSPQMKDGRTRVPSLDGIRGVAVLMVLWWHYFNCQLPVTSRLTPWTLHARNATSLFWSGVDLFFVLSGFLITQILLHHARAQNLLPIFFLRRATRILPLYFLVLALAGLAYLALGDREQFKWLFMHLPPASSFLTFTQNIVMGIQQKFGGRFLGMTWSLAVEEQFYLIWPFVILLCRGPRNLLLASIAFCFCAPYLRSISGYLVGMVNMPHRADSLLFGAIAAMLVRDEVFVATLRSRPRYLGLILMALAPGVVLLACSNHAFGVLDHFILSLFYAIVVLQCVVHSDGKLAGFFSARWLQRTGVLSYGLYMFHEPISGLLHGALRGSHPSIGTSAGLVVTLLSLGLTFLAAPLSMRYFERHFLAWGRRFDYHSPAPEPSPSAEAILPRPAIS